MHITILVIIRQKDVERIADHSVRRDRRQPVIAAAHTDRPPKTCPKQAKITLVKFNELRYGEALRATLGHDRSKIANCTHAGDRTIQ